jgi:hypothetical protein
MDGIRQGKEPHHSPLSRCRRCKAALAREVFMVNAQASSSARRWEDLASILLGIVAAAAAIYFHPTLDMILINSVVVGLVIAGLAALDLTVPPSWEEPFELIAGMWLALSPAWLEYGDPLRIIHIVIGGLVMILAAVEFWQDRKNIEAPRRAR